MDLGSGLGKPVFMAAMICPWGRCTGVELMGERHDAAVKALEG
jgi:hypothetical protein